MKVIIASSNQHKIQEIAYILQPFRVMSYTEIITECIINEKGTTFEENAIIKAQTVLKALKPHIPTLGIFAVLSDDSGLCVKFLDNKPGILSARYSHQGDDKANLSKLIQELGMHNRDSSPAYFCSALALLNEHMTYTMHGYLHGMVVNTPKGNNGFGYDPIFIPQNTTKTLAEISFEEKNKISHRYKALRHAKVLLKYWQ